jgi:hypothetical protein
MIKLDDFQPQSSFGSTEEFQMNSQKDQCLEVSQCRTSNYTREL